MIQIKDRQKEIIQWSLPSDKKNPTVFHLKWLAGPKEAYMRMLRSASGDELSYDEWMTDTLVNSIVKVENWDGKELIKPEEIKAACMLLTENETYLLLAAIRRDGDAYSLGVIEKN